MVGVSYLFDMQLRLRHCMRDVTASAASTSYVTSSAVAMVMYVQVFAQLLYDHSGHFATPRNKTKHLSLSLSLYMYIHIHMSVLTCSMFCVCN